MKKRWIVLCAGAFALLLLSLVAFAGCAIYRSGGLHFGIGDFSEKASREDTKALEIAAGQTLTVDLPHGDIHVEAIAEGAPSVTPSITASITAWGRTREEAAKALGRARVEIRKTADGFAISLADTGIEESIPSGRMKISADADFRIRVPRKTLLALSTASGDLEARGPLGSSRLHSSYGDVRASEIDGDLVAESSSGDVEVAGAKGGRVVAKTNYGDVKLSSADAPEVEARSGSGDVSIEDVRGERIQVTSDYGDVRLTRVTGEIEAKLSSGSVHAKEILGNRLSITSAYGDIRVEKANGALEARTESGGVRVSGFEGRLVAHSSYGEVEAEGVFAEVSADSSSGSVAVRALPGSKANGPWKLASSYGDVTLCAPDDFACDLSAQTDYGDLDVGFTITVEAGGLKKKEGSMRGKLNGGGAAVSLTTSSGDVRLKPLSK